MKKNYKRVLLFLIMFIFSAGAFSTIADAAYKKYYYKKPVKKAYRATKKKVVLPTKAAPKTYFDFSNRKLGNFKSYMDYRKIKSVRSAQYKLQKYAYTGDYGIRTVNGYYMVAVSSTFGKVGDKIQVTLSSGVKLNCIIGDIKANTNLLGGDGSMVEFIVNTKSVPRKIRVMGTFGVVFPGTVTSIEKIK